MNKLILLAAAAALTGCVAQDTVLRNDQGQSVKCADMGLGLIGAPAALIMHADCMKKAHAAGYSENPTPALRPTPAT